MIKGEAMKFANKMAAGAGAAGLALFAALPVWAQEAATAVAAPAAPAAEAAKPVARSFDHCAKVSQRAELNVLNTARDPAWASDTDSPARTTTRCAPSSISAVPRATFTSRSLQLRLTALTVYSPRTSRRTLAAGVSMKYARVGLLPSAVMNFLLGTD